MAASEDGETLAGCGNAYQKESANAQIRKGISKWGH
jgi:hypothetical protein